MDYRIILLVLLKPHISTNSLTSSAQSPSLGEGLETHKVNPVQESTGDAVSIKLEISKLRGTLENEICDDLQNSFGVDVSSVFKKTRKYTPPRLSSSQEHVRLFNVNFNKLYSSFFNTLCRDQSWLKISQIPKPDSDLKRYICKHLLPTISSIKVSDIHPYAFLGSAFNSLSTLEMDAEVIQMYFRNLVIPSNDLKNKLSDMDEIYKKYYQEREKHNNDLYFACVQGDTLEVILEKIASNDTDFLSMYSDEEIGVSIKILYLQQTLKNCLLQRNIFASIIKDNKILLLLSYLLDIQKRYHMDESMGQIDERATLQRILGIKISKRAFFSFIGSRFKREVIDKFELDTEKLRFITKVAITYPQFFLYKEDTESEDTESEDTESEDATTIDKLMSLYVYCGEDFAESGREAGIMNSFLYMGQLEKDETHIIGLVKMELENLSYISDLSANDVGWIYSNFGEDEDTVRVQLFHSIDHDELLCIQTYDPEKLAYAFSGKEELRQVLSGDMCFEELERDLLYIPKSFSDYREKIEVCIGKYDYKNTQDIESLFTELCGDQEYESLVYFHDEVIFPERHPEPGEVDELDIFYIGLQDHELKHQQEMIKQVYTLSEYFRDKFIASCIENSEILKQILIETLFHLHEFCNFLQDQDAWEDILTAASLFWEYGKTLTIEQQGELCDIHRDLWNAFGEQYGNEIIGYGFNDDVLTSLSSLGLTLNGYGQQMLLVTFEKPEFQDKKNCYYQNPEEFISRIKRCKKVILFLDSFHAKNIKKPDELFQFLLLEDTISDTHIETLVESFDSDSDISERYEEFVSVVMHFLKHGDSFMLDVFDEREESNTEETENKKERKTPKNKRKKKKGYWPQGNIVVIKLYAFSSELNGDLFAYLEGISNNKQKFVGGVKSLLEHPETYDSKIYAYIISQIGKKDYGFDESTLRAISNRFAIATTPLSPEDISKTVYSLRNDVFGSHTENILVVIRKKISRCSEEFKSKTVARLLFGLRHFHESKAACNVVISLLKKIDIGNFEIPKNRDITMMLDGLLGYSDIEDVQKLQDYLFQEMSTFTSVSEIGAIKRKQIYTIYKRPIPKDMHRSYLDAVPRLKEEEEPSQGERLLFGHIKEVYPDAQLGYYIDGFECDIYIPSIKTNIEYDGPHHRGAKKKNDKKRDIFLQEEHSVKTIRVPYTKDIRTVGDRVLQSLGRIGAKSQKKRVIVGESFGSTFSVRARKVK